MDSLGDRDSKRSGDAPRNPRDRKIEKKFANLRFGDDRRDLQHRRQEGLVLADEEGPLRRAVHVQDPEQDAQDHGEQGQQGCGHFSGRRRLEKKKSTLTGFLLTFGRREGPLLEHVPTSDEGSFFSPHYRARGGRILPLPGKADWRSFFLPSLLEAGGDGRGLRRPWMVIHASGAFVTCEQRAKKRRFIPVTEGHDRG